MDAFLQEKIKALNELRDMEGAILSEKDGREIAGVFGVTEVPIYLFSDSMPVVLFTGEDSLETKTAFGIGSDDLAVAIAKDLGLEVKTKLGRVPVSAQGRLKTACEVIENFLKKDHP